MTELRQEMRYTSDQEFVNKVKQAIEDYLFDPDSERISTRFKASWLDLDESAQEVGAALKQLDHNGVIESNSKTKSSKTWRYLGDEDDTSGGDD